MNLLLLYLSKLTVIGALGFVIAVVIITFLIKGKGAGKDGGKKEA